MVRIDEIPETQLEIIPNDEEKLEQKRKEFIINEQRRC